MCSEGSKSAAFDCIQQYYRARYYHPAYGQFISRDPLGLQGGINPYAYVDGNPTNFNDPSGMLLSKAGNAVGNYYSNASTLAVPL